MFLDGDRLALLTLDQRLRAAAAQAHIQLVEF